MSFFFLSRFPGPWEPKTVTRGAKSCTPASGGPWVPFLPLPAHFLAPPSNESMGRVCTRKSSMAYSGVWFSRFDFI